MTESYFLIHQICLKCRYCCSKMDVLCHFSNGVLSQNDINLMCQLAAHKMVIANFPKIATWWDAVKAWLDVHDTMGKLSSN